MKGLTERRVLYGHVFRNAMLIVIAGFPVPSSACLYRLPSYRTGVSLDGLGYLGTIRSFSGSSGGARQSKYFRAHRPRGEPGFPISPTRGSIRASIRNARGCVSLVETDRFAPDVRDSADSREKRRPTSFRGRRNGFLAAGEGSREPSTPSLALRHKPAPPRQFPSQQARSLVAVDLSVLFVVFVVRGIHRQRSASDRFRQGDILSGSLRLSRG